MNFVVVDDVVSGVHHDPQPLEYLEFESAAEQQPADERHLDHQPREEGGVRIDHAGLWEHQPLRSMFAWQKLIDITIKLINLITVDSLLH